MPIGKSARGFSYLGLLGLLALIGAGLAALGPLWSTALQRERERELQFRGEQIAKAIAAYRDARQPAEWPRHFDDLLRDQRGDRTRHHLRRLYTDPFTGAADWKLLPAPGGDGRFAGVSSKAELPRLQRLPEEEAVDDPRVSDWQFTAFSIPSSASSRPSP